MSTKTKIGFIGTGVMGKSMVRNLMNAGYPVAIYTRTKQKAEELIAEGADDEEEFDEKSLNLYKKEME